MFCISLRAAQAVINRYLLAEKLSPFFIEKGSILSEYVRGNTKVPRESIKSAV